MLKNSILLILIIIAGLFSWGVITFVHIKALCAITDNNLAFGLCIHTGEIVMIEKKQRLGVNLDDNTVKELYNEASRHSTNHEVIIEKAIKEYLNKNK